MPANDGSDRVKPQRNRVRVVAAVVGDPDEISTATAAFRQQGWFCRPSRDGEVTGRAAANRSWLVIEVRYPGSPRNAVKVASRLVDQVIAKFRLGVWVRFAEVIDYPRQPANVYYVQDAVPAWVPANQAMAQMLRLVGVPKITGLVRVAGDVEGLDVRAEHARFSRDLPAGRGRPSIRPAMPASLMDGKTVAIPPRDLTPRRVVAVVVSIASFVLAVPLGVLASWVSGGLKAFLLVVGIVLVLPLLASLPRHQPLRARAALAVTLVTAALLGGLIYGNKAPEHNPGGLLAELAEIAVVAFACFGLFLALRESPLARQVSWALPFTATVSAPLALWLGGNFDTEYLTDRFGIPASVVSLSTFDKLAIASKSLGVGFAFVLLFVGLIGWGRYFHRVGEGTRLVAVLMVGLCSAVYLLTAISLGIKIVGNAADAAANAAVAGRQPGAGPADHPAGRRPAARQPPHPVLWHRRWLALVLGSQFTPADQRPAVRRLGFPSSRRTGALHGKGTVRRCTARVSGPFATTWRLRRRRS